MIRLIHRGVISNVKGDGSTRRRIILGVLVMVSSFIVMDAISKYHSSKLIKVELYPKDKQLLIVCDVNKSLNIYQRAIKSAEKKKGKFNYDSSYYRAILYYENKKTDDLYIWINYDTDRLNFQYRKDKENMYVIPGRESRKLEGLIFNRRR